MESVLGQVLDFSRASKVECSSFDFGCMVEQTLELARRRIRRPEIELLLSKPAGSIPFHGNYDQLSHAIFQIFKLVTDDVASRCKIFSRIEQRGNRIQLQMTPVCDDSGTDKTKTALEKTFAHNPATHRLSLMVAAETLKYHGGKYELVAHEGQSLPSIALELPIV